MVAVANPIASFLWGEDGTQKTPEQVKREREIAAALMKGGADYSPVGHWAQGLARATQGILGGLEGRWANEAEAKGQAGANDAYSSILASLTGGAPTAPALGASAAVPATVDAATIRDGLISRGLPEHVADGFLMNFQDESGLNSGINEQNPTVPGSRGGYGLYQLTGPRRVAYEQYAAQKGVAPSDTNAQLDFMMTELQGPEANAAKSIMAAPDAGSAAAAIATNFLRPAPENLAPRVAKYTSGGQPTLVASLDPSIGAPAAQPQAMPAQQQIAQALSAPAPQAPASPQSGGMPSIGQLAQVAGNGWLNDSQRSIIQSLLGQQMQTQQQANDPLRQLQIQQAQKSLETPPKQWQKLDDHTLFDPITGETQAIGGAGAAPRFEGTGLDAQAWNILQSAAPDSKEYATAYSIIAQPKPQMVQTENGMMLVPVAPQLPAWLVPPGEGAGQMAPPQSPMGGGAMPMPNAAPMPSQQPTIPAPTQQPAMTPNSGAPQAGAGQIIPGTRKPSTEAQQRNEMLGTVLTSDLPTINANFDALADPKGQLLSKIPFDMGNVWQSEEYQQAANAVSSSVSSILYSVSGASSNPGEVANQVRNLTPAFGDKPGTIADKKRRLNTFINAVSAASGNPDLITKAREESMRGMGDQSSPAAPGGQVDYTAPTAPQGWGGDAALWQFMSPEDRALW